MNQPQRTQWKLDRQINLSALVQIGMLAVLIIISWMNLQSQLDMLGRDVSLLLENQKDVSKRLEDLLVKTISHEVRIKTIESSNDKFMGHRAD